MEKCDSRCPDKRGGEDFICERPAKHTGKHSSDAGGFWTDGGAEKLRKEIAAKVSKQ
jgi:hypothetical protein